METSLSGDQVSANQQAPAASQTAHLLCPLPPLRASTRVRFATVKIMESRQALKKRKAAPAEEPATKKPRTTIKPSPSTTHTTKASTADKGKSVPKAPATKKAAKETDKTPATKKAAKGTEKAPGTKKAAKETAKVKPTPAKASGVKGKKRAIPDDADADVEKESEQPAPTPKPAKVPKQPNGVKPRTRAPQILPVINAVPTVILDVYVFGEGSASELGLGNAKNAINVKRPRLNPNLSAKEVGVVAVSCGGMHSAAITHDNIILTWGVNDLGALGRDTTWKGAWKDANAETEESVDDDEVALNPQECNPGAVSSDHFPEGTKFAALACGDSSTFVLTDTGLVYGWGTFRGNEGVFGFSTTSPASVQTTPVLIEGVINITQIACGANHVLALNQRGEVWTWGSGEQNQLGHRIVERRKYDSLSPKLLRIANRKLRLIGCGQDHSFVVDALKRVWVWGVNSFGQAGVHKEAGRDGAIVFSTKRVESLTLPDGETIEVITGGAHHSAAVTSLGRCLVWGRIDGNQMGLPVSKIPTEDLIYDNRDQPRILIQPTALPGLGEVVHVTIGTDHTIAINSEGKAYSWGFNVNYQCGQGNIDDIVIPTLIDNTAVRGKKLNWAGAGGQFSILAGPSEFQKPVARKVSAPNAEVEEDAGEGRAPHSDDSDMTELESER